MRATGIVRSAENKTSFVLEYFSSVCHVEMREKNLHYFQRTTEMSLYRGVVSIYLPATLKHTHIDIHLLYMPAQLVIFIF